MIPDESNEIICTNNSLIIMTKEVNEMTKQSYHTLSYDKLSAFYALNVNNLSKNGFNDKINR